MRSSKYIPLKEDEVYVEGGFLAELTVNVNVPKLAKTVVNIALSC